MTMIDQQAKRRPQTLKGAAVLNLQVIACRRVHGSERHRFSNNEKESLMSTLMSFPQIALIILGVGALVFLVAGAIFGLGLYQGWFSIGPGSKAAKHEFRFTMDDDRVEEPQHRAQSTKRVLECQAADERAVPVEKAKDLAVPPVQPLQNRT